MRLLFGEQQTVRWVSWGSIAALVLLLVVVAGWASRRVAVGEEVLNHFDGSIYNSHTRDKVKSDLYVRAGAALKKGDAEGAERIYRDVVVKYPTDPDGFNALGASLVFQQKYEGARGEYFRALALDSKSVGGLYGLGCVDYYENRDLDAKASVDEALALDGNNADCHRLLGCVYDHMGDAQRAVAEYERAIALSPGTVGDAVRQRVDVLKQ
jgi:Flp pilus assembly protein TadD